MARTELPSHEEIRNCIELDEFIEAIRLLRLLEKEEPENLDIQTKIAYCLIQNQQYAQAEDILHDVLSKKPNHANAGQLLRELERMPTLRREKQKQTKAQDEVQHPFSQKKLCPECEKKVERNFLYCPYCRHLFKGQLVWRGVMYVGLPVLLIVGARYLLHSVLFPETEPPPASISNEGGLSEGYTAKEIFLFFYEYVLGTGALFGAALLVNYCLPDRKWNEEWKYDLAASLMTMTGVIFTNILVFGSQGAFLFIAYIMQIVFLFLFFQKGILATVVLLIFFVCCKAILMMFFNFTLGIQSTLLM